MRVVFFAHVAISLNPYILLYKEALERQGISVSLERKFSLKWLLGQGKSCDAIHLHWIEATYRPGSWSTRSSLLNKLANNRLALFLRGVLRLANFSTALFLAKLQGKTFVYTVHNIKPNFAQSKSFILLNRIAQRLVLSLANRIHAHSHYVRETLANDYGKKEGVIVVPHGSYVGYYPNQMSRPQAREQLGLSDGAFVYLFLGLLRPYKGLEDLIDAFEELGSSSDQLLLVGRALSDSYKDDLVNLCQNRPGVRLIPEFVPDEDIQLYMNACDICVLPYKDMTTSGAAALALSFGRPIIAPAITSFPELVIPQAGLLYDPSRPEALSLALQQAKQRSWSEAQVFDYVHQFDWDELGPRLASLYEK